MALGKFPLVVGALAAITPFTVSQAHLPARADYKIAKLIPLGPGERWDYVTFDSYQNRIYVAHGDYVSVVDATSGAKVGAIGPLPGGTHGIAVSPENGAGFTDDGKAGVAAVFDLKTLKIIKEIPTAPDADGIVHDPSSHNIFVINGDSGSVTAIDPKTQTVIATIPLGGGLEAGVVDGHGKLFVDGAENHDVVVVDTHTNRVLAHYPLSGCERPHGIAVDPTTHRIFVTCVNKMMVVVDANTGKQLASFPIGAFNDGAAFDAKRKLAISSNGEGTITTVQETGPNRFAPRGSVMTWPSARTIAIDPATGRLFLPAADISKVEPPTTPGGRPHITYVPGSLKLLVLQPAAAVR
jgi:YVTN family beta-propeller protein